MKGFFRFSLVYLLVSLCVTAQVRGLGIDIVPEATFGFLAMPVFLVMLSSWIVPVLVLILFAVGPRNLVLRRVQIGYAVAATIIMQVAFSFLKSAIPHIVPFYSDPTLAWLDNVLHLGVDPWELAHAFGAALPVDKVLPIYSKAWAIPALALPLIIAATDGQADRSNRFIFLYVFCWIGLGNVAAILGSSVGPVFYDGLIGGDRFAGLDVALDQSGVTASDIGGVQRFLWHGHVNDTLSLGSGISAFPSVHLGIATVAALYLGERSRRLIIPGVAFVGLILYLSVFTGFHYAVDSYASILTVLIAWKALRLSRPGDAGWWNALPLERRVEVRAEK